LTRIDFRRRQLLGAVGAMTVGWSTPSIGHARPAAVVPVSDAVLDAILAAGKWSSTADDNGGAERIPEAVVKQWVQAAAAATPSRQAIADLGTLVLTLSVAEWGVEWQGAPPSDPANEKWAGPPSITQGKHLMSYALGGIGLPHLDVGDGPRFFRHLSELLPENVQLAEYARQLPSNFQYDRIRAAGGMCDHSKVIGVDIFNEAFHHDAVTWSGDKYCRDHNPRNVNQPEQWQTFRSWARLGLRRKDMQRWVVDTWINDYWLTAYDRVMNAPHGSMGEAFVIARIWNSGSKYATDAMSAAASSADPARRVQLALDNYCARKTTYANRRGVMQRPFAVYQMLVAGD